MGTDSTSDRHQVVSFFEYPLWLCTAMVESSRREFFFATDKTQVFLHHHSKPYGHERHRKRRYGLEWAGVVLSNLARLLRTVIFAESASMSTGALCDTPKRTAMLGDR